LYAFFIKTDNGVPNEPSPNAVPKSEAVSLSYLKLYHSGLF